MSTATLKKNESQNTAALTEKAWQITGFIIWDKEHQSCWSQWVISSVHLAHLRRANHNTGYGSSCLFAKIAMSTYSLESDLRNYIYKN